MTNNNRALESLSKEETKIVTTLNQGNGEDLRSLDTSLTFIYINFCNIRVARYNFTSGEHHLDSSKPHLLFFTEIQVSVATDASPFFCSRVLFFILIFKPKLDFANMDIMTSESLTIWLKAQAHILGRRAWSTVIYLRPYSDYFFA